MVFKGGQPVMDNGLENAVQISLFTKPGWWGNVLAEPEQEIGSDFEQSRIIIDIETLNNVREDAEDALRWLTDTGLAESVDVETSIPAGQINTQISIAPPGQSSEEFLFTQNGLNWIGQALNPAHGRF